MGQGNSCSVAIVLTDAGMEVVMATRKRVSGTVPNLILVFENGKLAVVGKRLPTKRPSKKRATKKKSR